VPDDSVNQRAISAWREAVVSDYAERWGGMVRAWRAPRSDDAVWLMYSANYLFNTRGLMWAVDPVFLGNRAPEAHTPNAGEDLAGLDFALLTHAHIDHVDMSLWAQLKGSRCHWVVPEYMVDVFTGDAGMGDCDWSVAVPGEEIAVRGARIVPFVGPHHEHRATGETTHVDSTGYLVETDGGSYLFPGDVRTYDPACLSPFKDVSAVFAHVFLGRSAALADEPPLLDAFVDFYVRCRPKKIALTHLFELGREPADCWIESHAEVVADAFRAADAGIEVLIPDWYEETVL
jgi:beta-lactamase family protein